jgi:hypothetical protein
MGFNLTKEFINEDIGGNSLLMLEIFYDFHKKHDYSLLNSDVKANVNPKITHVVMPSGNNQ